MKRSFTLLEFIFVIVIIGILVSVIIPRTEKNRLHEAATQLISHIRYTQHLAIIDDKYDIYGNNWFKKRWQIIFGTSDNKSGKDTDGKIAYSIFSDSAKTSSGRPDISELAVDPLNSGKYLSGGFSGILYSYNPKANLKMNLGISYDITEVVFAGGCKNSKRISFDHMGRPISGSLDRYTHAYKKGRLIHKACTITLKDSLDEYITIVIEPETGYAHIIK